MSDESFPLPPLEEAQPAPPPIRWFSIQRRATNPRNEWLGTDERWLEPKHLRALIATLPEAERRELLGNFTVDFWESASLRDEYQKDRIASLEAELAAARESRAESDEAYNSLREELDLRDAQLENQDNNISDLIAINQTLGIDDNALVHTTTAAIVALEARAEKAEAELSRWQPAIDCLKRIRDAGAAATAAMRGAMWEALEVAEPTDGHAECRAELERLRARLATAESAKEALAKLVDWMRPAVDAARELQRDSALVSLPSDGTGFVCMQFHCAQWHTFVRALDAMQRGEKESKSDG